MHQQEFRIRVRWCFDALNNVGNKILSTMELQTVLYKYTYEMPRRSASWEMFYLHSITLTALVWLF